MPRETSAVPIGCRAPAGRNHFFSLLESGGTSSVSGLSSLLGYSLFQDASANTVAFVLCFAAGGILAMLAETMMPEAFEHGGKLVGIATTLGFVVAFGIHQLD